MGLSARPLPASVAAIFIAVLVAAYQVPYRLVLLVGSRADAPFVEAFWERDETQGFPFRWSRGESTVVLPGVPWHAGQELVIRAALGARPADAPRPTLRVVANEREVAALLLDPELRNYSIPLPPSVLDSSGTLRLSLHAPTFERGDRELGVMVEKVRLEPGPGSGVSLPPLPMVVLCGLIGFLSVAVLLRTRIGRSSPVLLTLLGAEAAALGGAAAWAREWAALAAPYLVGALSLAYLLACHVQGRRSAKGARSLEVLHALGIDSPGWRASVAAAIVALAVFHFATLFLLLWSWGPKDVRIYRGAGALWLEGGDYYDVPAFRERFGDDTPANVGFAFTNPPTGAMLYAPLALLPVDRAASLWRLMSVAFLLAAGLFLWSWGRSQTDRPPNVTWLALMLCLSRPTRTTLELGQVGTLVLLLLAVCLWALARGRRVACGVALAGGALVKVLPGFPIVLFLARRDWRAVGAAAVVGAAGLAAAVVWGGLAPWVTFFERVLPALSAPTSHFLNQSPQAFFVRLWGSSPARRARFNFTFEPADPGSAAPRLLALGLAVALLAFTAWWMRRHDDDAPGRRSLELATMIPLMLLVAPLVWAFYLAWLLVPMYVILVLLAVRPLRGRTQGGILACLGAAWMLMQVDTSVVYRIEGWPVPLMSLGLYATLLVFAASLWLLGALSPRTAPS